MYLTWETETMPEVKNSVLRIDDVRISIGPSACEPNEKWQHFSLTFGELTGKDHDDCQRDWPCRAIELARQKLDELEAKLGGPKTVFGERTL